MERKPKILFVSVNNVGLGFSGADRIFTELLKGWKDKASLTLLGCAEAIEISKRNGVNVRFLETGKINPDPPRYGLGALLVHTARRIRHAFKALRKYKEELSQTDIVYSVSDFYPDFLPAFFLKMRNPKMKWIAGYYLFASPPWRKNSPYKGRNAIRGLVYWLMQRPSYLLARMFADAVFVTSAPDVPPFATKKRDASRIIVVQGGVDIAPSEAYLDGGAVLPVELRKYDACFIGRLHYQKGVMLLPEIWKAVVRKLPGAKLAVIGDGHLEQELKEKIAAFGLDGHVKLMGFMDGEEKFEVLKQSKIMLHPATYDSGGMAAAEGMAWGLPAVSFDLEALETYYPKGVLKVPAGDTERFAGAILSLLENGPLYRETRDDALALIRETWDWSKRSLRIWEALERSLLPK